MYKEPLTLILFLFSFYAFSQVDANVYYNGREAGHVKDSLGNSLNNSSRSVIDSLSSQSKLSIKQVKQVLTDSLNEHVLPHERSIPMADSLHDLHDNLNERYSTKRDSLYSEASVVDEVMQKADSLDPDQFLSSYREVYSERMIKHYLDSVTGGRLSNIPIKKEITGEELIGMLNERFAPTILNRHDSLATEMTGLNEDLSGFRLEDEAMQELSPLAGEVIKPEYFEKLDSLRNVNLESQGLRLREKGKEGVSSVISIEEKLSFWDKTYFEGIIGLGDLDQRLVQVTPALGYHFTDYSSFGLGPIIQFAENKYSNKFATIGLRPFLKQEFLKQRAYLQVEYNWNPTGGNAEQKINISNRFLGGGGVLFPLSSLLSVNMSVMYQMNKDQHSVSGISPWVVRVGISTTKIKK